MDKKQIEAEIKAKKEAIKQANRELSKLQDELKKETEPLRTKLLGTHYEVKGNLLSINITANKSLMYFPWDKIERAIESLSDQVEPKSYVDWDKIPVGCNWVAKDESGVAYAYPDKPFIIEDHWFLGHGTVRLGWVVAHCSWRDSLIHRPGVKE